MFMLWEIGSRQVFALDGLDEGIQHFGQRSIRDPYKDGELLVTITGEALGDIARR